MVARKPAAARISASDSAHVEAREGRAHPKHKGRGRLSGGIKAAESTRASTPLVRSGLVTGGAGAQRVRSRDRFFCHGAPGPPRGRATRRGAMTCRGAALFAKCSDAPRQNRILSYRIMSPCVGGYARASHTRNWGFPGQPEAAQHSGGRPGTLGTQGTLIQAKWVLFVYPEYSSLSPTVISGLEGCIMPLWAVHAAGHGKPQRPSPQAYDTPFESPRWGLSKNAEKNMSRCHETCPHLRISSSNLESGRSLKIPDIET